jgi:hypothetical protein
MAAAEEEQEAWQVPVMATHHLLIALLETCPDIARPFTAQDVTAERVRSEARLIVG